MSTATQTSSDLILTAEGASAAFATAAAAVIGRLQTATLDVLKTAPAPITRAVELHRLLDIQASLGWQIFRLANAADPLSTMPFIPGSGLMRKFLRVAGEKGLSAAAVDRMAVAYADFERFVTEHAEDRETFDAMVAALAGSANGAEDDGEAANNSATLVQLKERRVNFKSCSRLWGVQAKVWYRCSVRRPTDVPGRMNVLMLSGFTSLRQSRPGPGVLLMRRSSLVLRHSVNDKVEAELTPSTSFDLLSEFCHPFPVPIESVADKHGNNDMLRLKGIGQSGRVDCFASHLIQDPNTTPGPLHTHWASYSRVLVPCELLITDILVPKGLAHPASLRVSTHGNAIDYDAIIADPSAYEMPFRETGEYLGTDLDDLRDPALPKCAKIANRALRKVGWDDTEFDIFRCRVRYPLMHSAIRIMVFDKPQDAKRDDDSAKS